MEEIRENENGRKIAINFENFTFQYESQSEPTLHDINLKIYEGEKVVKFIVGDIIISILTWVAIAPALDIVIYKEPQGKVFVQGFAAALSNASVVAILGTILIFAFSKTIVSKGSLRQE